MIGPDRLPVDARERRGSLDKTRERLGTVVFFAVITVCAFYDIYRYPLRINDSSTSPEYSDTPFELQAGKYLLLGLLTLPLLWRWRWPQSTTALLLLVLCAWMTSRSALAALLSGNGQSLDIVAPLVCGGTIAVLLQVDVKRFAYCVSAGIVALHAVANVIQIVLLMTTGRLPALAYSGDAIKRFGGAWDDPNSVGLVSGLFLVYLVATRRRAHVLAVLAAFNVIVSLSYSAVAAVVVGVWVVLLLRTRTVAILVAPVILVSAVALLIMPVDRVPVVGEWLDVKQESSTSRLDTTISFPAPESWLVGGSVPDHTENAVAATIGATGVVGLVLLIAWCAASLRSAPSSARRWVFPVFAGFAFASLAIPYTEVFPVATLFAIGLSQISYRALSDRTTVSARAGAFQTVPLNSDANRSVEASTAQDNLGP
jgi:hypothetical protein